MLSLFLGHNSVNTNERYAGLMDEWGTWSRALTSDEVIELYNSGNGNQYPYLDTPTITTNLQTYYDSENISVQLNTTTNTNMSYVLDAGSETSICNECNNSILNLSLLAEGLHNITFISTDDNGQVNTTDNFTIDTITPIITNLVHKRITIKNKI